MTNQVLRLCLGLLLLLGPASAHAALSPDAYDQIRGQATVIFGGVVLGDAGGQAQVRVEVVHRGPLSPGQLVWVSYPEDRGQPQPPGAPVYYRRFMPGARLMVWGHGVPQVTIVHGGIDILSAGRPPPKSGSCGACAAAGGSPPTPYPAVAALLLAAAIRRRRRVSPARRAPRFRRRTSGG